MAWVRIDDGFADHPKVASVGPLGMAYQIAALCYCNKYLTDGYLPASVSLRLCHLEGLAKPEDVIARLVDAGMWEEVEGGYIIHDYLEYQPSKAQVEAAIEQRREAGRRGGLAKAKRAAKRAASETFSETSSENVAKVCPNPNPNPLIDDDDARARAEDDPEFRELTLSVFGLMPDRNASEMLFQDMSDLGADVVKEALRRTVQNATGNRRAYYRKIVGDWRGKVTSLEDVRRLDEAVRPPAREPPRRLSALELAAQAKGGRAR